MAKEQLDDFKLWIQANWCAYCSNDCWCRGSSLDVDGMINDYMEYTKACVNEFGFSEKEVKND